MGLMPSMGFPSQPYASTEPMSSIGSVPSHFPIETDGGVMTVYGGAEYAASQDPADLVFPTMSLRSLVDTLANPSVQILVREVAGAHPARQGIEAAIASCSEASTAGVDGGAGSSGSASMNQFDVIQVRFLCDQVQGGGFCRILGLYAGMTLYNVHRALSFALQHEDAAHDELFHAFVLPDGTVYGHPPMMASSIPGVTMAPDRSVTLRDIMGTRDIGLRLVYILGKMQLQGILEDVVVGQTSQQDLLWLPRVCQDSYGMAPPRAYCYDADALRNFDSSEGALDLDRINKVLSETRFGKNLNGKRGESKRVGLERYACTSQYILKSFRLPIREFFTGPHRIHQQQHTGPFAAIQQQPPTNPPMGNRSRPTSTMRSSSVTAAPGSTSSQDTTGASSCRSLKRQRLSESSFMKGGDTEDETDSSMSTKSNPRQQAVRDARKSCMDRLSTGCLGWIRDRNTWLVVSAPMKMLLLIGCRRQMGNSTRRILHDCNRF
eukprot:Selendium_serpulae@DN5967_c0_g1_i1.p1